MAVRESKRIDLALARGVYLVVLTVVCIPVAHTFSSRGGIGVPAGLSLLRSMLFPSSALLFFLALRLGSDAVGDSSSGMLDLLKMSGTTTSNWLLTRLIQVWTGFLSVWVIRLPMLALAWVLGGVTQKELISQEGVLLFCFAVLSSLAMLHAHTAESRRQVTQRMVGLLFGIEWLLALPKFLVSAVASFAGVTVPVWLSEVTSFLIELRFSEKYQSLYTSSFSWRYGGNSILMYGGIGLACLGGLWLGMFDPPADRPETAPEKRSLVKGLKKGTVTRRPSRRSWDDALAWQAFNIHTDGRKLLLVKLAIYLFLVLAMPILFSLGYKELGVVGGMLFCGGGMLLAANKPGDCIQREIKDQTLPSLLLAPIDSTDLYTGWRNGAWRLIWPDLLMAPLLIGLCVLMVLPGPRNAWEFALVIPLTISLALLCSGPFMMLSPMVPFSGRGITTGIMLLTVSVAIAVLAGVLTGITQKPFVFPAVSLPLWWSFNYWVKHSMLPYWLALKVTSLP